MTTGITNYNIAQGDAEVGLQVGVVHGEINYYQESPDQSPEERFQLGVKYLDARARDRSLEHIEDAVAHGYVTNEVQFHRLLALLSGRTLSQLSGDEFDHLITICRDCSKIEHNDEWAAGLKAIIRLLTPITSAKADLVLKELDGLEPRQRDKIFSHLEVLLEGSLEDEIWQRSLDRAQDQRMAGDRANRVWKFFHPTPAPPRTGKVAPASTTTAEWLFTGIVATVFLLAAGEVAAVLLRHGALSSILGYVAGLAGLAALVTGGADQHFRQARIRAKDAQLRTPRQRLAEAPQSGFADQVDRLFEKYFRRYVPRGTDRGLWLAQTAGIRRQLRDELVEAYREQRIPAERIAWLVRYLVGDVRHRWERNTLTVYRDQVRTPLQTIALILGGLATLVAGSLWAIPAVVLTAPLSGTAWLLLAAASAVLATRSGFNIVAERRRVAADEAERAQNQAARQEAYERWQRKLADKPSDAEMAAWLECDRKLLVDQAMRHYRLRPSQIIAHAFIEAPAASYKRARYPDGPWRYSRYRLLLFLLTDDGVRQVTIDLDFETADFRTTERLNYRFEAVAAVRIDGVAAQQQTFELTLFNGEPISVRVTEANAEGSQPGEDPSRLAELALDASGLAHTLHVLEGIAAEGKEWVRHRRRRADERLADLAEILRDLLE
jgi:hypothetical protein